MWYKMMVLALVGVAVIVDGFVISSSRISPLVKTHNKKYTTTAFQFDHIPRSSTDLQLFASPIKLLSRRAVSLVASLAVFLVVQFRQRILWPGAARDSTVSEPLPIGSYGCPFLGSNILAGNKRDGPELFYRRASETNGNPKLWKFYFMGAPCVVVRGASLVAKILSKEFDDLEMGTTLYGDDDDTKPKKVQVFGTNNVMFEKSKSKHQFLRRLVGASMTPGKVAETIPILQRIATESIRSKVQTNDDSIPMEDVAVEFTLRFMQEQLLGLKLSTEESQIFQTQLSIWVKGLYDMLAVLPLLKRFSPAYKARLYMEKMVGSRIQELKANGPDTSTLSNMLFTVDEDGTSKLTEEQVMENAFVLIIAGSETSAGVITMVSLLLGLHPDAFQRLRLEQESLMDMHGNELTKDQLEQRSCPYLDAVVKEALRLGAITAGFPRLAKRTLIVDGQQIPAGWSVVGSVRLTHQLDPTTFKDDNSHMDVRNGFDPERWLSPETVPQDFIPFGVAPRFCLGANLAIAEIKVFTCVLVREATRMQLIGNSEQIEWNTASLIPKPADGVIARLK